MSAIKRILALGAAIALLCPSGFSSAQYSFSYAKKETFIRSVNVGGDIHFMTYASVNMPVSGATLTSMDVLRGDEVKAGDVIGTYTLEVNPADIVRAENALSHAISDMEFEIARYAAEADEYMALSSAEKDPDQARIYELQAEKCRLESEMYQIDAQAEITRLENELAAIKSSTQVQEIKAPMDGRIDSAVASGVAVERGRQLITMHDSTAVLVRVTDYAGDLRYGMSVDLKLAYHSSVTAATGTVVVCDSVLPASMRTGTAYIAYDAAEKGSNFTGATVSAEILRVEDAVIASTQALTIGDHGYCVQILDPDGTLRTRYVSKGFENSKDTWIVTGVNEGDKLIMK